MNKTKKIIIIVNSHLFVQQHLRGILSQKKFNTKIYIASNKNSNYFKKIKGINYINLLITRRPSFLDFISFISFFIIRLKVRPDITLSFTPKAGLINSLTTLLPGKTIHYFTGQRWVTFKGMKKTFYKLIDQFIIFCCTKTYSDSNSQSEFIAKSLSTKRPSVIHFGSISGVNLKLFNPSKKINIRIGKKEKMKFKVFKDFIIKGKDIKDKSIFGFVGRVHEDKGIFMLLRAFEKHLKNFPDDKLIIIGPIETPLENLKILGLKSLFCLQKRFFHQLSLAVQ